MANYEEFTDNPAVTNITSATVPKDGYKDPAGVYPKKEYENKVNTNEAARGIKRNKLYLGGGDKALSLDLKKEPASVYPLNQVKETVSGHVTEVDDTPGAERMLFRHRTGAGVEMRADGTVIVSSTNNTIRITGGDEKVIVEGDGHIIYNGNLTLNVSGDFDLKVGGDYNLSVAGDKVEQIDGSAKERIEKNTESTVVKNRAFYTTGTTTETVLGSRNTIVKGDFSNYVEGNMNQFSGQTLTLTTQDEIVVTSPNINMSAESLTVIGDSGTMGGENIIAYNYNMYTGHSIEAGDTVSTTTVIASETMTSKEFIGSLTGNADTATQAGSAGTAGSLGAGGSAGSKVTGTAASVDTAATVLPTTAIINDYLTKSSKGIRTVKIDPSNAMKDQIDRSAETGGVSTRKLSTAEVRSKMRDPKNASNQTFVTSQVAQGVLSAEYILAIPPKVGRIVGGEPGIGRNSKPMGNTNVGKIRGFTRS